MSLAQQLWEENADLAAAALGHPFIRGLADGTLPRDVFAGYVAQDAFFLEAFTRAYALALAHSPDCATLDTFAELLAGARAELGLHTSYAERCDIDLPAVTPTAATLAYTDFLLATASLGGVGLTCAALTPCMRLYAHLGQSLSADASDGGYAEWVATYADPAFEELAATLEGLLDAHSGDIDPVRVTYRRAMQLEIGFFDAAYRRA